MAVVTLDRNTHVQSAQKLESKPEGPFVTYIKVGESFQAAYAKGSLQIYLKSTFFNADYCLMNARTGVEKKDLSGKLIAKLSLEFVNSDPKLVTYYRDIQYSLGFLSLLIQFKRLLLLFLRLKM
ncbi:MAG: hypothetical protein WC222_03050 [Parachlamydiales bacterium]